MLIHLVTFTISVLIAVPFVVHLYKNIESHRNVVYNIKKKD